MAPGTSGTLTLSSHAERLPAVAGKELQRDLRRRLEMRGGFRSELNRDRRNAEQLACGGRGHGAGVDRVVAHVGAEVDAGHHHVGQVIEQPVTARCTQSVGVPFTNRNPLGARRTVSGRSSVSEFDAPLRSRSGATTVICACGRSAAASCSSPGAK
jgi:hypothetical protein